MSDPLRDALRVALLAEREAVEAEQSAAAAAARGQELAAVAAAELARFGDVDAKVANYRADLVRAGRAFVGLPDQIALGRLQRRDAEDDHADALAAAAALDAELATAAQVRMKAASATAAAAASVMLSTAEGLAHELQAIEQRAADLRMTCACVPFVKGSMAPPMLFQMMNAPVANAPQPFGGPGSQAASSRWSAFLAELHGDADAVFSTGPRGVSG